MDVKGSSKVSIVLPVYNGSKYLRESIDSCLGQTYANIELIIVDDCSTDDTPQIIKSYNDPRIRYIRNQTNQRLPRSLNIGFTQSTGEYLTWTSDDNCYAPQAIERMLNFLVQEQQDFVYCNYYSFSGERMDKSKLVELPSPPVFNKINPIRACFLYSRKVKDAVGDYDPETELIEDYDYWIRVSKKFEMGHIAEPLYYYRYHETSLFCSRHLEVQVAKYLTRVKYGITGIAPTAGDLTALIVTQRKSFITLNKILTRFLHQGRIRKILKDFKNGITGFSEVKKILNGLVINKKTESRKPQNIAFIIDGFPVVSETFILNQITGLMDLGCRVEIFPTRKNKTDVIHPDVLKYKLLERTHYTEDIIPSSGIRKLFRAVRLFGGNFFRDPAVMLKSLNIFKYKRDAFNLRYFLYAVYFLNKDIIYCHYGTNGRDYVFLKDIFGDKVKFITTFHAYELTKSPYYQNGIYKQLFRRGDLFLPVSRHWRDKLTALGCPAQRILVHHMGIDPDQFAYRHRSVNGEEIRAVSVARLVEKKGLEYSIRAVARVIGQYPKLQYDIAGDGPLLESLKKLIGELGMQNHIHLLGPLPSDQVKDLMDKAHIFLLTSVTAKDGDQEGIPVSLMEAMAMGLPVISTYHSGIPELIDDGKTGFLVPERDEQAIIEKLKYLIEHQELWTSITTRGRKHSENEFNIKKLNRELVGIFNKQLQSISVDPDSFL